MVIKKTIDDHKINEKCDILHLFAFGRIQFSNVFFILFLTKINCDFRVLVEGKSLKVLGIGLVLGIIHSYSGLFAFMSYMSNIFAATKTDLHPDTNTIITGVVQVIGSYLAIGIVDRYGRRILMITSITGVGLGTAALGLYAFLVEKNDIDLSSFSYWLPVFLMSFIIFMANIGLNAIVYVIMVEILPSKVRN